MAEDNAPQQPQQQENDEEEELGEEESSTHSARQYDDDVVRKVNLAKLNEYIEQFAYRLPKKNKKPDEYLDNFAMDKKLLVEAHLKHGDVLSPKGRAKRVKDAYDTYMALTTEEMQAHLQQIRNMEKENKKLQGVRDKKFLQTKIKLEKQCQDQIMLKIVTKFGKVLAEKSVNYKPPDVITESFKRLQRSLMCNIHLALGIPTTPHSPQYGIYNSLSSVLADMILQGFFKAQSKYRASNGKCTLTQFSDVIDTEEACINERAKRAAKKEEKRNAPKPLNPDFERLLKMLSGMCCEINNNSSEKN